MAYDVQVGTGGYQGWKLLERTMTQQRALFSKNYSVQAPRDYFSKKITEVKSADDLVSDHRLLMVTLRAFGLDDDIKNKFFIKKVLESDPQDGNSFVNRLADKRYLQISKTIGFSSSQGDRSGAIEKVLSNYDDRSFEKNIGQRHNEIELALNAKRELSQIAKSDISDNAKWYQILASKPLRKVFEKAFGLGSSFSALPIDRQLDDLKEKVEKLTGSDRVSQFQSPDSVEALNRRFLLRNQQNNYMLSSRYSVPLVFLRS